MAGRKPVPTALKLMRGNPGKRPINKREPKPAVGIPVAPDHLSKRAAAVWPILTGKLSAMGVLTTADGHALELLAEAYAEWRDASDAVREHGQTYESQTQNGTIIRPRPEVSIASDAWRRVAKMLTDFGLTPSSRAKLSTGSDAPDESEARFFGT